MTIVSTFLQPVLGQRWAIPGRIALAIVSLVTALALAYYSYRTAEALGEPTPGLWVAGFVLLNIIALAFLSSKAATICRQNGIPVGLPGPRLPS